LSISVDWGYEDQRGEGVRNLPGPEIQPKIFTKEEKDLPSYRVIISYY